MGKTIAERLRDAENAIYCMGDASERVLGKRLPCKICTNCNKEFCIRLAEAIEEEQAANPSISTGLPEGIEWPRYESGELVRFGDEVNGQPVSHFYFGPLGCTLNGDSGTVNLATVRYSEWLTREKPDTQEAIDEDAAKDPCEYFNGKTPEKCAECRLRDADYDFDYEANYTECRTAMNRDLLRRQRRLMGGE